MVNARVDLRKKDDEVLGAILCEVIDRRRRGEFPTASEYALRYPHLRKEIEADLHTISLLEGDEETRESVTAALPRVGWLIARLPALEQHIIFLRNFEKRRWEEIARILDRQEMDLRRTYAGAIGDLLAKCSPPGSQRSRR